LGAAGSLGASFLFWRFSSFFSLALRTCCSCRSACTSCCGNNTSQAAAGQLEVNS
jgi:hypothetical protein